VTAWPSGSSTLTPRAGLRGADLRGTEEHDVVGLTEADRVYLRALEPLLDMYPDMRATEGE
jgi:hypothetical protein